MATASTPAQTHLGMRKAAQAPPSQGQGQAKKLTIKPLQREIGSVSLREFGDLEPFCFLQASPSYPQTLRMSPGPSCTAQCRRCITSSQLLVAWRSCTRCVVTCNAVMQDYPHRSSMGLSCAQFLKVCRHAWHSGGPGYVHAQDGRQAVHAAAAGVPFSPWALIKPPAALMMARPPRRFTLFTGV